MEIKNYASAINAYRYTADTKLSSNAPKAAGKTGTNKDKAEFSAAAKMSFAEVLESRKKASDGASSERINALRTAVKNGSYSVSAEDVADSILGIF